MGRHSQKESLYDGDHFKQWGDGAAVWGHVSVTPHFTSLGIFHTQRNISLCQRCVREVLHKREVKVAQMLTPRISFPYRPNLTAQLCQKTSEAGVVVLLFL